MEKLTIQEQLDLMRSGKPYDAHTPEMYAWRDEVKKSFTGSMSRSITRIR